jgi:signal transduction histidine kinase
MKGTTGQAAGKSRERLAQEVTALRRRLAEELEARHEQTESEPGAAPVTLRSSDARYRATLDAMSDMIHVVDDKETVASQARRARDIVRNMLDFARQTQPQRLPADVADLLHQTLELIRRHLEGSGVLAAGWMTG